jgi:hypothetical protein
MMPLLTNGIREHVASVGKTAIVSLLMRLPDRLAPPAALFVRRLWRRFPEA